MAQYKHLPIYKTTYELLKLVTEKTKHFPKDFKYSLGDKLRNEVVELVVFIYKANSVKDKRVHLLQILERIQVVEMLLLLCRDLHIINIKGYSSLVILTDSIGRQVQGWIGSQGGQNVT